METARPLAAASMRVTLILNSLIDSPAPVAVDRNRGHDSPAVAGRYARPDAKQEDAAWPQYAWSRTAAGHSRSLSLRHAENCPAASMWEPRGHRTGGPSRARSKRPKTKFWGSQGGSPKSWRISRP